MKKTIALVLTASLLLTGGCSSSTENENNTSADTPAQTVNNTENTDNNETTANNETEDNTPDDDNSLYTTAVNINGDAPTSEAFTLPDPPAEGLSEEEQRQYMIDSSLMSMGDTSRLINVFKKAAAGEEITIGFIGGSITEGLTAGSDGCYAKLTYNALCEMFPDTKINYVNAGLSGTPSVLGVVRAERDLFAGAQPDIVFVEFAVNDGGEPSYKACYESLVKKCLDKENSPAVVLLFTVLKNRYSCQNHMSQVGGHYNLPMISVGNAINPMFDMGYMEWTKYSEDESHPNVWGHALVKDFIMNYFEKVKEEADGMDSAPEIAPLPDTVVFSTEYANTYLLERNQMNVSNVEGFKENDGIVATFRNGWIYRGKGGASVTFTEEFKDLFLVFHCNNSDGYANAQVFIDGELVNDMPSGKPGGWGNPEADVAYTGDECKEHTVEIKIPESDSGLYYGLLGVGVTK